MEVICNIKCVTLYKKQPEMAQMPQIISKQGLGDRGPRFKERREYQPPPREPPPLKPIPQCGAPFNSTSERKSIVRPSDTPAPNSYLPEYKKQEMDFAYSFNGRKVLKCAVKVSLACMETIHVYSLQIHEQLILRIP
ncbi:hypothetical protein EVAR_76446_1 [Eumeta japonica]|uniref:Uncharacterized protein n=1 Tax=Eumeta variegata TaxID=151549 RepID=A0A4C1T922_EUMVA|nr:hypothetical protein EVAR_76446_1 [Eumeta japonica]